MKKIVSIVAFVLVLASPGTTYRFVCNGILANGDVRNDECGPCDEENAARWDNPSINVVVDENTLPQTLTKNEWQTIVTNSFKAWQTISGTSLRFIPKDSESPRAFGANDDTHEIFWITDKEEWRKFVGSGEFGTLGATLPRYSCGGDLGAKRELFDADLVLNGLPHIKWKLDCQDENCISVQPTLVHELGHFFGLDHPCLMCNSIMSARAGYDLPYPVQDDMEGIRALYPNGETGGYGVACENDRDCNRENRCVNDKISRYCTKDCNNSAECNFGSVCKSNDGEKVCGFMTNDAEGEKKEGENCMRTPCEKSLVCAGASKPNFYCYRPCVNNNSCLDNQECIPLKDDSSICVTIRKRGEECDHRDLCEDELYCVFDMLKSGFCRIPCKGTSDADSGCPDGEVCEFIEGIEICLPKDHDFHLDENAAAFSNSSHDLDDTVGKSGNGDDGFGCNNAGGNQTSLLGLIVMVVISLCRRRLTTH